MFAIGPEPLYRYHLSNTFPKPKFGYPVNTKTPVPPTSWTQTKGNQPKQGNVPSKSLNEYLRNNYPDQFSGK